MRIGVFGSGGVGKTRLVEMFICGVFYENYDPNIEDSYRKQITMDGSSYILELLDSAGQQEFTAIKDLYIKNSNGVVLVYSIIDQKSFVDIPDIHANIVSVRSEKGWDNFPIVVAGNKIDLDDKRVISKESGEELAKQLGCSFIETSAKAPINVNELFETCARMCIQQRSITMPHNHRRKGGCSLI
uniref:Uncharacterized protein n=1 Tax=Arcella intermedia TaxID=1963864 RepID=A0A6B2LK28_9EUKA